MCIYFVFELLLFIVVILTFRSSDKVKTRWLIFFGLYFALITGLRGYYVGNDTSGYVGFFTGRNIGGTGYGTIEYPSQYMETGFVLLAKFLSLFSRNGTFFLMTHALFVWLAIAIFYKDRKNSLWSFLLVFLMFNNTPITLINIAIRQSFSVGFVLWGFYLLKDIDYSERRKLLRSVRFILGVVCIVFAIIVHRTSIMLIPLAFLIYFIRTDKRWIYYTAIILSFIVSEYFMVELGQLFDTTLSAIGGSGDERIAVLEHTYEGTFGGVHYGTWGMLAHTLPCLLTVFLSNKQERSSYAFRCLIFWICLFQLFRDSNMVFRLSMLFYVLGIPAFIPKKVNKNNVYFAIYLLFTAYFLVRAYLTFEHWRPDNSALPYYFFWE